MHDFYQFRKVILSTLRLLALVLLFIQWQDLIKMFYDAGAISKDIFLQYTKIHHDQFISNLLTIAMCLVLFIGINIFNIIKIIIYLTVYPVEMIILRITTLIKQFKNPKTDK